jgi:hypothetical protein
MAIQVTPSKLRKGGQYKHWAEEARVWIWYRAIKLNCDLSDYALDKLFAWTENGQGDKSTDERPRTFEWLRKKARKPRGIKNKWRTMDNLVATVNQDKRFYGTKDLYYSDLWKLLQKNTHCLKEVQLQFDELINKYKLIRVDSDSYQVLTNLCIKYGKQSVFDRCLRISLRQMNSISAICLVWIIGLMARSPQTNYIREIAELTLDKRLDDFFGVYFNGEKLHLQYYTDAIEVFLNSKIESISNGTVGYGYVEVKNEWIILPHQVIDNLSEEVLYPLPFAH